MRKCAEQSSLMDSCPTKGIMQIRLIPSSGKLCGGGEREGGGGCAQPPGAWLCSQFTSTQPAPIGTCQLQHTGTQNPALGNAEKGLSLTKASLGHHLSIPAFQTAQGSSTQPSTQAAHSQNYILDISFWLPGKY